MPNRKLSPSAISAFLKSPKAYYWQYVARLIPAQLSVVTYDHDKIAGTCWAAAVDRFYKGFSEATNVKFTLDEWTKAVDGWVPEAAEKRLRTALENWTTQYYQMFSQKDGCRGAGKSELWLENDIFWGRLDGLSDDGVVHEVKSTSRAKIFNEQLWKVEHSIQVKLYCVLAHATGYRVEFAFKDPPYQLYRGDIVEVTPKQLAGWEQELTSLATMINGMGTDEHNYPCHTDCILATKNFVGVCQYQLLCEHGVREETALFYKQKSERKIS